MINSVWYQSLVTGPNSGMWVISPSLIARNCTRTSTKTWGRDGIWIFATPILSNRILVISTIFVDKSMVNQYIWPISPEIGLIAKKLIEILKSLQFDSWTVSNFKWTIYENNLVFHWTLKNTFAFRVLIKHEMYEIWSSKLKDMAFKLPSLYFNCIIWSTLSC